MNDNRVDIGNVQTRFNNRCGNQHVNFPVDEIVHDFFQLMLLHLSMGKGNICFRHKLLDSGGNVRNVVDAVIHIINLAASCHFPDNGFPHHFLVVFAHIGLDGQTLVGCLL